MLTTALEVTGFALIAAAAGLTFGLGALLLVAGVELVLAGVAVEYTRPAPTEAVTDTDRGS